MSQNRDKDVELKIWQPYIPTFRVKLAKHLPKVPIKFSKEYILFNPVLEVSLQQITLEVESGRSIEVFIHAFGFRCFRTAGNVPGEGPV